MFEWLKMPEIKNIQDLDDPSATLLHTEIIRRKTFLRRFYLEFYNQFKASLSNSGSDRLLVELGSGGGFIKEVIPEVITSDILNLPNLDSQFSVLDMPFEDNSVDAFFMIDVLHHISDTKSFLKELNRCLKIKGKIIMVEPANTLWSRFIYRNFHHEAFDPSGSWGTETSAPLSSANGAIPWIIFYRDRFQFENEFPTLKILKLKPHTPFRYLASGGVSMRQLLPSFAYNIIKWIEIILSPLNKYLGMFLTIEIGKTA